MTDTYDGEAIHLIKSEEEVDREKQKTCCCCSVAFYNVLWMGACFLGLFSCFNPIQALQGPTNAYGNTGLGILYACLAFSNLFSSTIVRVMGQKIGVFFGGCTYVYYIGTLLLLVLVPLSAAAYQALYYVASAVIGFGAAILWTSQGSLLTVMAEKETLGLFNGVFWGVFMVNYGVGGLITQFVLNAGIGDTCNATVAPPHNQTLILRAAAETSNNTTLLYIIFASLAGASVLGLLLLRTTPSIQSRRRKKVDESKPKSSVFDTLLLFKEKKVLLLVPSIAYSGLSAAYINVIYPTYIGERWIGYCLVIYGTAEVLGSILGGKLSDKIGRTPVFVASCVATALGVLFASLSSKPCTPGQEIWYYFVSYFFLGLGDSGFNTQVQAALGYFVQENTQAAFSLYRMILSIFAAIGSFGGSWTKYIAAPFDIVMPSIVLWALVSFALLCWMILDKCVASVTPPKERNDIQNTD